MFRFRRFPGMRKLPIQSRSSLACVQRFRSVGFQGASLKRRDSSYRVVSCLIVDKGQPM